MKIQLVLFLLFSFGCLETSAQYGDIEITETSKTAKDNRRITYTNNQIVTYFSGRYSSVRVSELEVNYFPEGQTEAVYKSWPSHSFRPDPSNRYAVSFDGGTMVQEESKTKTLQVYDLLMKTKSKTMNLGSLKDFQLSPDGSLLAVGRAERVELIDLVSEKVRHSISGAADELIFSADGKYLALLRKHSVEMINLWTGASTSLNDLGFVKDCTLTINGKIMVVHTSKDIDQFDVFDIDSGKPLRKTIKKENVEWYHYSIHPLGEVIQVDGDFYNLKSKKPFRMSTYRTFKFHPTLLGVFVTTLANEKIGAYTLKK